MWLSRFLLLAASLLCASGVSLNEDVRVAIDQTSSRHHSTRPYSTLSWHEFSNTVLMLPQARDPSVPCKPCSTTLCCPPTQDCSATRTSAPPSIGALSGVLANAPDSFDWRARGVISPVKYQVRGPLTQDPCATIGNHCTPPHPGTLRRVLDLFHDGCCRGAPCNQVREH